MTERCSNPANTPKPNWTCPRCWHDLGDVGVGRHVCPFCNAQIACSVEDVPYNVTETVDGEDDDEDDI
jgi:hypothetical protein